MRVLLILLTSFIILSANTCRKGCFGCAETVYGFEAKVRILNHSDSISIGDTLWLDITSPVSQIEAKSGQVISYSKATNLGTAIGLGELVKPTGKEVANDFDYYLITGTKVNNPNTQVVREYLFSERSSTYQLGLGIIPKRKGIQYWPF